VPRAFGAAAVILLTLDSVPAQSADQAMELCSHNEATGDWTGDAPGVRRLIAVGDLPEAYATRSSSPPLALPKPACTPAQKLWQFYELWLPC